MDKYFTGRCAYREGSLFWIDDGSVMGLTIDANDRVTGEPWEMTAPESPEFIEWLNDALGTDFAFSDFAGR